MNIREITGKWVCNCRGNILEIDVLRWSKDGKYFKYTSDGYACNPHWIANEEVTFIERLEDKQGDNNV